MGTADSVVVAPNTTVLEPKQLYCQASDTEAEETRALKSPSGTHLELLGALVPRRERAQVQRQPPLRSRFCYIRI